MNKKLLSIGSVGVMAIAAATVVSCSPDKSEEKHKWGNIEATTVGDLKKDISEYDLYDFSGAFVSDGNNNTSYANKISSIKKVENKDIDKFIDNSFIVNTDKQGNSISFTSKSEILTFIPNLDYYGNVDKSQADIIKKYEESRDGMDAEGEKLVKKITASGKDLDKFMNAYNNIFEYKGNLILVNQFEDINWLNNNDFKAFITDLNTKFA